MGENYNLHKPSLISKFFSKYYFRTKFNVTGQSTKACINYENLTAEINCFVHKRTTELDNVCDEHKFNLQ